VVNGAGAAGIACAEHYICLGVQRKNITLVDTKGIIYKGRTAGMNPYKERFAGITSCGLLPMRPMAPTCCSASLRRGHSQPR